MDIELTPEQVDNIFSRMGKFDAELGINWDFIENLIQEEVNPIDHSINIEPWEQHLKTYKSKSKRWT